MQFHSSQPPAFLLTTQCNNSKSRTAHPLPYDVLHRLQLSLFMLDSRLLNRSCVCGAGGQVRSCGLHACQRLSAFTHGLRVRHQLHRVHIPAAPGLRLCAPAKGARLPRPGNSFAFTKNLKTTLFSRTASSCLNTLTMCCQSATRQAQNHILSAYQQQ